MCVQVPKLWELQMNAYDLGLDCGYLFCLYQHLVLFYFFHFGHLWGLSSFTLLGNLYISKTCNEKVTIVK